MQYDTANTTGNNARADTEPLATTGTATAIDTSAISPPMSHATVDAIRTTRGRVDVVMVCVAMRSGGKVTTLQGVPSRRAKAH